ncbi:MAG TPA: hypothetical protein ENK50_00125 [Sedimenticola sp.]|nr:hypothetical protein [Sedimenticola sp.]
MKTRKLIRKMREYLSADRKKQRKQVECMIELLKKLKHKERTLQQKLEHEKDEKKRQEIQNNLDIIFAQRRKGVAILKELKKGEREE